MTPDKRLQNILLATKLGPLTPFFGLVAGQCECGKPKGENHIRGRGGKLKAVTHKPGKHPRDGGWQRNATTDQSTIRQWFNQHPNGNFAVISGVNTVALDFDVRQGKDGIAELHQLEAASGQQLPPTITVLSGSGTGAQHRYFRIPADVDALKKPKGTKAIDFQRNSQAVIVPGSLHESGHFYTFAPGHSPAEIELAELPDWLLDLMRKPNAQTRKQPSGAEITDDIEELFDELLKMGPPIGSMQFGRLRPDAVVQSKMKKVPLRKYPDDRSYSDSHWAWTLARNTCHHWEQYLRIWKDSAIRTLPDTKCGRASYEADILNRAFLDQKQQWKNRRRRPIEQSTNPVLAKDMRRRSDQLEMPKSPIAINVLYTNYHHPNLTDSGIAEHLNATGSLGRKVSRDYVKHIRHRYKHLWTSARPTP